MARDTEATKEATILSLSQDIRNLLGDFQERLDNRFNRNLGVVKDKSEASVIPNVLEEIIKELEEDKAHLTKIMSFVSSDVLPRIN